MMGRFYKKHELAFSLIWIGVYVVLFSVADALSTTLGVEKVLTAPVGLLLTAVLLVFLRKENLTTECGLTWGCIRLPQYLFFAPLVLLASTNLWGGVTANGTALEMALYVLSMICVGTLEELIFRGLLFTALRKENITRAVIISSLTFGIGHIVNLLNGAQLLPTLLQIVYATAAGFLFTVLFHRSGSLLPCIITHCAINSLSAFALRQSPALEFVSAGVLTVVAVAYGLWILWRTDAPDEKENTYVQ